MALFPNDLRIYISSSPLECKIDSLSIFISSVICLCTTMFGHFSVHQHPGVSRFASLTSLCSSFLAAFALYTAAPAFRRFSKYFHFFVFFFGVAVSSEGAIFFPFLYRPKSRFFLSFFINLIFYTFLGAQFINISTRGVYFPWDGRKVLAVCAAVAPNQGMLPA